LSLGLYFYRMSGTAITRTYFPHLDASRFLAFVPVFLTHVFFTNNPRVASSQAYLFVRDHLQLGLLGLDYFFVLSGFLITWIMSEEASFSGTFSLKNFYIRRSLRIFPLYFFVVFLGFTSWQFTHWFRPLGAITPLPPLAYFLTFTLNFYIIHHGMDFLFFLVFFWSVSVEEQFYLAWALLLKFFHKYILLFCLSAIAVSLVFRWYFLSDNNRLVFHTVSSLADFALGAMLAWLQLNHPEWKQIFEWKNMRWMKLGIGLLFVTCLYNYSAWFREGIPLIGERLVFGLFFTWCIAVQVGNSEAGFLPGKWKWMDTWGKRSFGLYCYHGIAITIYRFFIDRFIPNQGMQWCFLINPSVVFFLTLLMTGVSYKYFEEPVFRMKKRFYAA